MHDHALAVDAPPGMCLTTSRSRFLALRRLRCSTPNYSVNVSGAVSTGSYTLEILRDTDGDGIGNKYDLDDDGDQFADDADSCPIESVDREGCPDDDGDGVSNLGDEFPRDATQQFDADQDGYGDNALGTRGDDCDHLRGRGGTTSGVVWTPTTTVGTTSAMHSVTSPASGTIPTAGWGRLRIPRCALRRSRPLTPSVVWTATATFQRR